MGRALFIKGEHLVFRKSVQLAEHVLCVIAQLVEDLSQLTPCATACPPTPAGVSRCMPARRSFTLSSLALAAAALWASDVLPLL